jgi:maltooligosyltrehalose synthase
LCPTAEVFPLDGGVKVPEWLVPSAWNPAMKHSAPLANLRGMLQKYVGALPQSEIEAAAFGYLGRFSEQAAREAAPRHRWRAAMTSW